MPWIRTLSLDDADDKVLEAMANGHYFWVPLEQVESILLNPPKFPRDLLWRPARLETRESAGEVFLPALYPSSHLNSSTDVKLGRTTEWLSAEGAPTMGAGAHLYLVDDDGVTLMEWRELQIGD